MSECAHGMEFGWLGSCDRCVPPIERVVAAAIQYDGLVFSMAPPARHAHVLWSMQRLNLLVKVDRVREEGFTTSLGRYVNREEGCQIARAAGQLKHRTKTGPDHALFSEDLW